MRVVAFLDNFMDGRSRIGVNHLVPIDSESDVAYLALAGVVRSKKNQVPPLIWRAHIVTKLALVAGNAGQRDWRLSMSEGILREAGTVEPVNAIFEIVLTAFAILCRDLCDRKSDGN